MRIYAYECVFVVRILHDRATVKLRISATSLASFFLGEQGFFYAPPKLKDLSTTQTPHVKTTDPSERSSMEHSL